MSVSADMYIVISLMFAVFAAVAAVGSSMVLGIGFERLRAGFEIVKKQTGFFADAIHKLDQRADHLDQQQGEIKETVSFMNTRVERVEKQTDFFFNSITSLESQILEGKPMDAPKSDVQEKTKVEEDKKSLAPNVLKWTATSEARSLLQSKKDQTNEIEEIIEAQEEKTSHGVTSMLFNYLKSDNGKNPKEVIYH